MSAERVIVLLDDVEQMTAIGGDLLQRRLESVRVVTFNKPREALAWMATAPRVDLVLTDFHMADMDGLAFLTEARGLHPDATRAIITAYLDLPTATAPELGARGVHALIRKPWEWSDFTRAVFELLTLAPAERAAIEKVGPMAYPEGAFAELAASRSARAGTASRNSSSVSASASATASAPRASPPMGALAAAAAARATPVTVLASPSTNERNVHPPTHPSPAPVATPATAPVAPPAPVAAPVPPLPVPLPVPQPELSPIPSLNDEEEARRLLAYLQTRPGVAARIRQAVEQAAQQEQQRRASPPNGRGG